MKKNYLFIALVMMLMAGFTACSNDDDKNDTTNPAPETENPAKRGLTDTDTKTTGVFEMTAAQQAAVTPLNFSLLTCSGKSVRRWELTTARWCLL